MKKLLLWGLLLAVSVTVSQAQTGGDGVKARDMTGLRIAGISSVDSLNHIARTTSSGYLQTYQMNRMSDDNTIIPVVTGLSLWPASTGGVTHPVVYQTGVIDLTLYDKYEVHVDWADTAKTSATIDSTCLEIYAIGKFSTTSDGYDYIIPSQATINNGVTTMGGWVVGSPSQAYYASTISNASVHLPTKIVSGNSATARTFYSVSFPLATNGGSPISENYLSFYVVNRGISDTNANLIHSLNIYLVGKAN